MSSYELANDATPPAAAHAPRPAKRPLSTRWISLLTLITLIAAWWAVTAAGLIEPLFLPPPSAVLEKAGCWQPGATWIPLCGSTWAPA